MDCIIVQITQHEKFKNFLMSSNVFPIYLQYKLDFSGLSGRATAGCSRDDEGGSGAAGDSKGATTSSEGGIWQYGMARRAKGDARRTRVSFLLF